MLSTSENGTTGDGIAAADDALKTLTEVLAPPAAPGAEQQSSQATQLVALASDVELFHTPDQRAFGTVAIDGHVETWPLAGQSFRLWLRREFYRHTEKSPKAQALKDALNLLEAQALFDGPEHAVSCRLGASDGVMYLDLANEDREVVAITPEGWEIIPEPPIKFQRSRGMAALPQPTQGGELEELRAFVNVEHEGDWVLLVSWLLAALQPTGPYPILVLHGEQGAGKSTASRLLRALIDPNESPLRAAPHEERDLLIAASHAWCLAFDNLSHIQPWLSDAFCRLATGGGFSTRQLYTDTDEIIFHAMRPVIINSIAEVATRGDLLDRALMLSLPPIPGNKRRDEEQFWRAFEDARPRILGALLTVMSRALRALPEVELAESPRMADFARFACAVAGACDWRLETPNGGLKGAEAFLSAYTSNIEAARHVELESLLAQALLELLAKKPWRGTASDLLKTLGTTAIGEVYARSYGWPKTPRGLTAELDRLAPSMRAVGVHITRKREPRTGNRLIMMEKAAPQE